MAEGKRSEDEANRLELPPGVKLLRTLEGHRDEVNSGAFDPMGQTLASGSDDKTVKLWEPASGKVLPDGGRSAQSTQCPLSE
ncbi:MAG: hypothetical protein NTZ17_22145 [Phycisphaerae bacterium]|nr:hypothetical protein [Phycisphaerae bacterium]